MSREDQFDYLFKIVIIGDSGVGKTNLLSRFVDNSFSIDSKPTIGVEFAVKTHEIDGKIIKNQIWDTAGQQRFRAITNAYYRGAQGAVVVYDVTKSKTFDNLGKWLSQLRENAEPNISIMLLGNKSDLENRDVKRETIEDFVKENNLLYMETSALSGANVSEAFNSLMQQIYEKTKQTPQQKTPEPTPKVSENKPAPVPKPVQEQKQATSQKLKLQDKNNASQKKKKDPCCK